MRVEATMQQGAASGGGSGTGQAEQLSPLAEQLKAVQDAQRQATEAIAREQEARDIAQAARDAAQAAREGQAVHVGPDGHIIVPGAGPQGQPIVIQPDAVPPWVREGPPDGVFMIPIALFASIAFVIVGLPIARAFGRRMDRKGAAPSVGGGAELRQLQTSLDAMAVEIERISENQRFLTRVLADRDAAPTLPSPDAPNALRR